MLHNSVDFLYITDMISTAARDTGESSLFNQFTNPKLLRAAATGR